VRIRAGTDGGRRGAAGLAAVLALAALAVGAAAPGPEAPPYRPERLATLEEALQSETVSSANGVVVTGSLAASRAGARILEAGGNAVDAAVAAAFTLGSDQPADSGLGGESWVLIRRADGSAVGVVCSSRVPLRASPDALRPALGPGGLGGHRVVSTPTSVATLAYVLGRFGTKPFAEILVPAIESAERGHLVDWVAHVHLLPYVRKLELSPVLGPAYLTRTCGPNGDPVPVDLGARVVLPGLARTLRRLAEAGPGDFYTGRIAAEIDADMQRNGGFVRLEDLARVPAGVREIEPALGSYRDREVLTLGTPASGEVLIEALHILETFPQALLRGASADRMQALIESVRLALADVPVSTPVLLPVQGPYRSPALDPRHARERAKQIRLGTAWNAEALRLPAKPASPDMGHTTQISVADRSGNVVSITQSIGRNYGSGAATPGLGFPYNSFLEWYEVDDPASPLYLRPRAFLRSVVAPTIVLRDGEVELAFGSPGSSRIVPVLVSVISNIVDRGLSLGDAVAAPRVLWQDDGGKRRLIAEVIPPVTAKAIADLKARGYEPTFELSGPDSNVVAFGGTHAVGWDERRKAWIGVGDPRRGGVAEVPSSVPAPPVRRPEGSPRPAF